jgi:hypothetical protein
LIFDGIDGGPELTRGGAPAPEPPAENLDRHRLDV